MYWLLFCNAVFCVKFFIVYHLSHRGALPRVASCELWSGIEAFTGLTSLLFPFYQVVKNHGRVHRRGGRGSRT